MKFSAPVSSAACWPRPVAVFLMGKAAGDIAFYAYIVPFLVSTVGGSIIAGVVLIALEKNSTQKCRQALPAETGDPMTRFEVLCSHPRPQAAAALHLQPRPPPTIAPTALSVGASPIMAQAPSEMADIAVLASAVVLNTGTP